MRFGENVFFAAAGDKVLEEVAGPLEDGAEFPFAPFIPEVDAPPPLSASFISGPDPSRPSRAIGLEEPSFAFTILANLRIFSSSDMFKSFRDFVDDTI